MLCNLEKPVPSPEQPQIVQTYSQGSGQLELSALQIRSTCPSGGSSASGRHIVSLRWSPKFLSSPTRAARELRDQLRTCSKRAAARLWHRSERERARPLAAPMARSACRFCIRRTEPKPTLTAPTANAAHTEPGSARKCLAARAPGIPRAKVTTLSRRIFSRRSV